MVDVASLGSHLALEVGPEPLAHARWIPLRRHLGIGAGREVELASRGRIVLGDPAQHGRHGARMAARVLPGGFVVVQPLRAPALGVPLRQQPQARRAERVARRRRSVQRWRGAEAGLVAPAADLPLGDEPPALALAILQLEGVTAVAQVPGALRILVVSGIERGAQLERELVALAGDVGEAHEIDFVRHRLAVHLEDHVADLQAGLAGRTVDFDRHHAHAGGLRRAHRDAEAVGDRGMLRRVLPERDRIDLVALRRGGIAGGERESEEEK